MLMHGSMDFSDLVQLIWVKTMKRIINYLT